MAETLTFAGRDWVPLDHNLESFDKANAAIDAFGIDDKLLSQQLSVHSMYRTVLRTENLKKLIFATVEVADLSSLDKLVNGIDFDQAKEAASVCLPFFISRYMKLSGISETTLPALNTSIKAVLAELKAKLPNPQKKPSVQSGAD